jgi:hypothetical protein
MAEGNSKTRARLEAAGCEVLTYDASEISQKGSGRPDVPHPAASARSLMNGYLPLIFFKANSVTNFNFGSSSSS